MHQTYETLDLQHISLLKTAAATGLKEPLMCKQVHYHRLDTGKRPAEIQKAKASKILPAPLVEEILLYMKHHNKHRIYIQGGELYVEID